MHWHFWIRTKVAAAVTNSASFKQFLQTCFGVAMQKIYTEDLYALQQLSKKGPDTPTKPGLCKCVLVCACVCVCVCLCGG